MSPFHTGDETVTVGGTTVRLPHPARRRAAFESVEVYTLDAAEGVEGVPDFRLPAPERNVVAVDGSDGHRWTVGADPEGGDHPGYGAPSNFLERCLCRRGDRRVELDVDTGAVLGRFPLDALPAGDRVVEFDDEVDYLETHAGVGLAVLDSEEGYAATAPVVAFDRDGTRLWRREFYDPRWLSSEDGRIVEGIETRMGCYVNVAHDPRTGEAVAIADAFTADPDQLRGYVPVRYEHLVPEYARRSGDGE